MGWIMGLSHGAKNMPLAYFSPYGSLLSSPIISCQIKRSTPNGMLLFMVRVFITDLTTITISG